MNEFVFRVIQNSKNAKMDMTHAHEQEFINFTYHNIDRDIVIDKRTCINRATFRGT